MTIAIANDVRRLGKLPLGDKIAESIIAPHLESAGRELERWLGSSYELASGVKALAIIESECCVCLSFLLPVLNTFYSQDLTSVQKELGEMDFMFHSPDEIKEITKSWYNRGYKAIAQYLTEDAIIISNKGFKSMRPYAL